jgi:DNA-binding response OmpR family regulator
MTSRPRVLIADEDEFLLQLLRLVFESAGFEVSLARDGRKALAEAMAAPPRVALLDVHMPGLDGSGVIRALRDHAPTRDVPVALMSGDRTLPPALRAGAAAYLEKPFSLTAAVAAVRALA